MQILRDQPDTTKGPAERFTGDVYVDAAVDAPARCSGGLVHFTPGARTAWHTHPLGQTIYVLEGIGRCQRKDGPIEEIHPGDRVFFEPNENHWHGAAPNRLMTHLALTETPDEGEATSWGEKVTDADYEAGQ